VPKGGDNGDASEADDDEWVEVIKEALAAGWTR
jgi:hypothetical protein